MNDQVIKRLPPNGDVESVAVLRALVKAHQHLAELKGITKTIPNERILLSTLSLQEAQNSSAIENIITTQDALYKYELGSSTIDPVAKEVSYYAEALKLGYYKVKKEGLLTLNSILEIQACLEGNEAGLRKVPGTVLRNEQTGEIVFEPPSPEKIPQYMSELEQFINSEQDLDPLVCMALIHHQFETIHPFYDGNGRTGRIINILYLVQIGLLDSPILYLSRYINQTKKDYYRELQKDRDGGNWESWILYILKGVALTAQHTTHLIVRISTLLKEQKSYIRSQHKFYSQDLINNLFKHPYTKSVFLEKDLNVSRATALRYLEALVSDGVLKKMKLGKENYYTNIKLVNLLFNMPELGSVG